MRSQRASSVTIGWTLLIAASLFAVRSRPVSMRCCPVRSVPAGLASADSYVLFFDIPTVVSSFDAGDKRAEESGV
jgi:hypothetical protein